ncbi:MAG: PilZ domain-containing protein [Methylobacteriaceae bacterium]|nr:PilZ domain-containing protein [Methylobacteriaceae bacterium]
MVERAQGRSRVLLRGRLATLGGAFAQACTVRDLSSLGARVEFSGAVVLPARVSFAIDSRQLHVEARVAWRRAEALGLAFLEPWDDATWMQRADGNVPSTWGRRPPGEGEAGPGHVISLAAFRDRRAPPTGAEGDRLRARVRHFVLGEKGVAEIGSGDESAGEPPPATA